MSTALPADGPLDVGVRGWLPIESAPKDGTIVLLYGPPDVFEGHPVAERITCGQWLYEPPYIHERRDLNGNYIGQDESDGFEGWMSWDGGFTDERPPVFWMPMPPPPNTV